MGDPCSLCPHPFDDHVLVATGDNPRDGGVLLCPVRGCECYGTWGTNDLPAFEIPGDVDLAALRAKIQTA